MSKISDRIKDANKEIPVEKFLQSIPKTTSNKSKREGLFIWMLKLPIRFIGAMMGIDKGTINIQGNRNTGAHRPYQSPSRLEFGQRIQPPKEFNPEDIIIQRRAERAYHAMVDGKGDHDCGHEH
jgi:hypothetical protein